MKNDNKKENLSAIFLIGLPGSGKTTFGKLLAKERGLSFIDLDDYIEEKEQMNIPQIFEKYGEKYFRDLENIALLECSKLSNVVIATGGGIVINPANRRILKASKNVVYIKRNCSDIIKNVDMSNRPLLRENPEKVYELYEHRHNYYNESASIILENDSTINKLLNSYSLKEII